MRPTVVYHDRIANRIQEVDYVVGFFGQCLGVILTRRDVNDDHVCVTHVSHDDGVWAISESMFFSSAWLSEAIDVLQKAGTWIRDNCDVDMIGKRQCGYVFKPGQEDV